MGYSKKNISKNHLIGRGFSEKRAGNGRIAEVRRRIPGKGRGAEKNPARVSVFAGGFRKKGRGRVVFSKKQKGARNICAAAFSK